MAIRQRREAQSSEHVIEPAELVTEGKEDQSEAVSMACFHVVGHLQIKIMVLGTPDQISRSETAVQRTDVCATRQKLPDMSRLENVINAKLPAQVGGGPILFARPGIYSELHSLKLNAA
jgi:hypothetical protein